MMNVMMNRIKFSFMSVVVCRFCFVFVNLLVSVDVMLLFGENNDGLDSKLVLLIMNVIVMVLFSVWFRFNIILLIIFVLVYGSIMFYMIFYVV